MQAEVPVEILAVGELSGATSVRIPRTDGHFTAQTACIGEGIGRNGRHSSLGVVVWLENMSWGRGGRGCGSVKSLVGVSFFILRRWS